MYRLFKCVCAMLVYWILLFIGPAFVMLFNNVGYYVTGGGWGPGSLMYKVLQFFSQPIACVLAYGALKGLLHDDHNVLVLVNCTVATCVCFLFVITASEMEQMWAMVVSVASCGGTAVAAAREIEIKPNQTKIPEPVASIPIAYEKNHTEKQQLREQIAKLKNDLKECDKSYEENKRILSEAFSDEELRQMAANGEFPSDRINEYIDQRRGLEMIISLTPNAREAMVNHIGDLTKQLAELECD